jgi:hypothetical protein
MISHANALKCTSNKGITPSFPEGDSKSTLLDAIVFKNMEEIPLHQATMTIYKFAN